MEILDDWFNDEDGRRSWLLDPSKAGGPLYDIASHRIDVLNSLFGRLVRVTAQLSNAVRRNRVEDNATLLIEYENLVRGIGDVRWHSRVPRDEFRIVGTTGAMTLSPLNGPKLEYPGGSEELPAHANLHYPMIENFVAAVVDSAHLFARGESSIWTDWVTEQAFRGCKRPAAASPFRAACPAP